MSTTPTLTYLQLDAQNDPVFDPTVALTDSAAVAQAILTRLRLNLGEWWEDINLGLPLFQKILGQLATKQGIAAMNLLIQQQILGTPYVLSVQDVSASFSNGKLSFTAKVTTQFGLVTVNNLPGFSASLDA